MFDLQNVLSDNLLDLLHLLLLFQEGNEALTTLI